MRFLTKLISDLMGKNVPPKAKAAPSRQGARAAGDAALKAAKAEAPLWGAMGRARENPPAAAQLVLQVPVMGRAEDWQSWLSSAPRLPADAVWPTLDGTPLVFLAQIDCSTLPKALWGGLGPRQGWLVIFLCPRTERPHILHTSEAGLLRPGPFTQTPVWSQPLHDRIALPRPVGWPVDVTAVPAGCSAVVHHAMNAEAAPPAHDATKFLLDDPAYGPFDAATVAAFIEAVRSSIASTLSIHERSLKRQKTDTLSKPKDVESNAAIAAAMAVELEKLARLETSLALTNGGDLTPDAIQSFRTGVQGITSHHGIRCQPDDPEIEERSFRVAQSPILTYHPKPIWDLYLPALGRHVANLHATGQSLPAERLAVWLPHWSHLAANEQAAMGHVPAEDIGIPAGPGTGRLVLLELPSSDHFGWNWGDVHNIALTIPEADLAEGRFDRVTRHIST